MQVTKLPSYLNDWLYYRTGYYCDAPVTQSWESDVEQEELVPCYTVDLTGNRGDDELTHTYINYNPFKHIKYASDEAREMTKQFSIKEMCKQYYPSCECYPGSKCNRQKCLVYLADSALYEVLDANKYIKISALNPLKMFVYIFIVKSQISGKKALELLRLPTTKSGKQFSLISKGRQLYQQYVFVRGQNYYLLADPKADIADECTLVKDELLRLHSEIDLFNKHTLDVINKTADLLVSHPPGVLRCQKKYKVIVRYIYQTDLSSQSLVKKHAAKFTIVLRNR